MTTLLAFDTSADHLSIALVHDGRISEFTGPGSSQASAQILPQILELIHHAGLSCKEIDLVAYGQGPGSFTGLRTSCSVAQGLAFGLNLPLLGLDSLMIVAHQAWIALQYPLILEINVGMDARMNEVYAASYRREVDQWACFQSPALQDLPLFQSSVQKSGSNSRFTGNACALAAPLSAPCTVNEVSLEGVSRSYAMAQLALERIKIDSCLEDAMFATPVYLRNQVALTTQERAALRSQKVSEASQT
jgi:tRNA threonylcarbamoyladenosine biosynthesis protein TsaB